MNVRTARQRSWPRRLALAGLTAATLATTGAIGAPATSLVAAETLAHSHPGLRALVVARGDCVVFEYYREGVGPATRSPVYSIAKSVLAILVGIAIDRGFMRLDESLPALMPEALDPRIDPLARGVTIRDLLTMTAGFEPARASGVAVSPRAMLGRPMIAPPGDRFAYDGMAADLLSLALSRTIKQNAQGFARRALFEPLGIRNYAWTADAQGRLFGETDLFLTARDMAKIGQLALQGGQWGGRRIVSQAFMHASTSRQSEGGPPLGAAYGYLWWVTKTPHGLDAFFAAGSGGQLISVVPTLDLVTAVVADRGEDDNLNLIDAIAVPAAAGAPPSTCADRLR